MVRIDLQHLLVCLLGTGPVLLLLKHGSNLKPHVRLGQRVGRVRQNVLEAVKCAGQLTLVFVYNTKTEVDFVGLVEVGVQVQHSNKRLLGILQQTVTVIQNTDSVPQLGHVRVVQVVKRTLVRSVGPL